MQNIISESVGMGYNNTILYIILIISVFLAIFTIVTKNPILSVLFLIGLFCSISIYLIMLGLHFLGLSYLLIYVGAISILFLFILMLINIRISELFTDTKNSIPLAILTIFSFNYYSQNILPEGLSIYNIINKNIAFSINDNITNYNLDTYDKDLAVNLFHYFIKLGISNVETKCWDCIIVTLSHISSIGNILYTNLLILFILTSYILLLAMIGAIIITINKPIVNLNNIY